MRKFALAGLFILAYAAGTAQNGYIILENDSILTGFIKYYISPKDQQKFLEFWETKNDKDPVRINPKDVAEYAINKDTFRIVRNFQPFPSEDLFIDLAEGKMIRNGRVQLLKIINPYYRDNRLLVPVPLGGTVIFFSVSLGDKISNVPHFFALREKTNGYMRGVPRDEVMFREVITDFFSDAAIKSYVKQGGQLSYRKLKDFVEYYNDTVSGKKTPSP